MKKMEKALDLWLEDQTQKKTPSSVAQSSVKMQSGWTNTLTRAVGKAVDPYLSLLVRDGSTSLKTVKLIKLVGDSASVDHQAVRRFPPEFLQLIMERG